VQVAWVQVQYLRQLLDEKEPPAQVAEGDATTCASGLFALVAEGKSPLHRCHGKVTGTTQKWVVNHLR